MENKEKIRNGQVIWKNIFEYHIEGLLNDSEFAELMDIIYWFNWDIDKFNTHNMSPKVGLIWKTLGTSMKESKRKSNKYYESHKTTITPNKEFEKPSMEDEYKVDMPNIQLEDEDIPAIEPEPTPEPEPEPVFKVSSEPVSKKFRYYDFDTNNSISINSAIESNKNNLTFGAVKSDLIKQIIKDGHTESEAENIYINILKTVTQNRGNDENPF